MKSALFLAIILACSVHLGCSPKQVEPTAVAPQVSETTAAPVTPSDDTPEGALQRFMIAMAVGDAKSLMAVTVPAEGTELLLNPQPLPAAQQQAVQQQILQLPVTRLKVGESFKLPDGKLIKMDDSMVNADRQQLTAPGHPFPFILVQTEGKWRVFPGPLIAMRKAFKDR